MEQSANAILEAAMLLSENDRITLVSRLLESVPSEDVTASVDDPSLVEELDRLTHRCHILEASGESYRLKDARRRSSGKRAAEIPAKPPEKDQSAPAN